MPIIQNEVLLAFNPDQASQSTVSNENEKFGAKDVKDLSWKNLLDAYSCTECGRCTASCPANITGKLLSPRKIMMDTRDRSESLGREIQKNGSLLNDGKSLLYDYIKPEELMACTTCNACVEECPVSINPLDIIIQLRRYLIMEESKAPSEWVSMYNNIETNFAPGNFHQMNGLNGLKADEYYFMNIPLISELKSQGKAPEILFWIGCAGSFDARAQQITRAFTLILQKLNIDFAILGNEELCTGDPARRSGNEFLFQTMAYQNIQVLNNYNFKKIVTTCPHCFNTLKNEYPELGGHYEVIHHSEFLQQLINEGKIVMRENEIFKGKKITFHDSCYLGRANGIYEAPRAVIHALDVELREMRRCKSKGLCCGAGGAQMFKEEEKGIKRINEERIEDALAIDASLIATSCPFCNTMLTDGIKKKNMEDSIEILDIAELIAKSM